ncbi:hypothetical protein ACWPKO_03070 [Coraliomargarita sp. W4R53]
MNNLNVMHENLDSAFQEIEALLERPKSAVCPIFRKHDGNMQSFGSGVFIKIEESVFLLSAAHVLDAFTDAALYIPCRESLKEITGAISGISMPESGNRDDDRYDFAYCRLDSELANDLHINFMPLDADDCDTMDTTEDDDMYTIVGFPFSRSKTRLGAAESEILIVTGNGKLTSHYPKLKLSPNDNIAVSFRPKKSKSFKTGLTGSTPKLQGISGGAILAWDKRLPDPKAIRTPKLCAIIHEFHRSMNCFVGTRLHCFLIAIKKNEKNLAIRSTLRKLPDRNKNFKISQEDRSKITLTMEQYLKDKRRKHNQSQ